MDKKYDVTFRREGNQPEHYFNRSWEELQVILASIRQCEERWHDGVEVHILPADW